MEPKEGVADMAARQAAEAEMAARHILKSFLQMEGVRVRPPTQEADDEDEVDQELEQGLLSLFAAGGGAGNGGSDDDDSDTEDKGPTFVTETYTRLDPKADPATLELSLAAGRHSLWGHKVWNAAKVLGEMLEFNPSLISGKTVLELGAGCALPSLLAALNGAKHVVASDYASSTDQVLVEAMQINVERLVEQGSVAKGVLSAVGYVWGQPIEKLLAPLGKEEEGKRRRKFDVIICADLIFNRSEHKKLLWTCMECLEEGGGEGGGEVLVAYSHHDPEKRALDMAFFRLAEQEEEEGEEGREGGVGGWVVKDVKMEQCVDLFVEGDEMDEERGKVYVKRFTRKGKGRK